METDMYGAEITSVTASMPTDSRIDYVRSSSVRTDVVDSLSDRTLSTTRILAALDASESAVYDALSNLQARGIIAETDGGWRLTGTGRLVCDTLDRQQATDRLLAADPTYWDRHDVTALPQQFRCRLPELGDYEIVRAAESDLRGLVPWVVSHLEDVESCEVISPMYHREYEEAMPDNTDSRLVAGERVIDDVLLNQPGDESPGRYDETAVRVTKVPFALAVSERWAILTIPEHGDQWSDAKLIGTADSAVDWGRELFEHVWAGSTPLETYLSN